METKRMNQKWNRVCLICALMLGGLGANAQSWDWSDCVEWFKYSGVTLLAACAHPVDATNNINNTPFTIKQTSPDIIVEIGFDGTSAYTCTYKIVRSFYNGKPYFKDVKVLKEGDLFFPSFDAWANLPTMYQSTYDNDNTLYLLYDRVKPWKSLSKGRKAACALTQAFVNMQ
ncbi:MAG: hypothetical protein K5778_10185 [Bacteroidaceae bacterium]|nr:hypothetical protein [Bacteroidaceae bacterium]